MFKNEPLNIDCFRLPGQNDKYLFWKKITKNKYIYELKYLNKLLSYVPFFEKG